jgi:hypothetical protein
LGQIRKIDGVYYIEFHARGLLYSQVAGIHFEDAQKLLSQVEEKIAGGEALTITRHIDLPDFFERFLSQARELYAPKTAQRFETSILHFNGFLKQEYKQVHELAQLTPVILESYKIYLVKSQKPRVVNLTILLMREVLDFGIKLGFLNDNPSLHVRLLPWPKKPVRKLTSRYKTAKELLSKGVGLGKLAQLLNLSDISRCVYFADSIPLSREHEYL